MACRYMTFDTSRVQNQKMPMIIYGTAWKQDQTANLVYEALKAGFRAIDTGSSSKHYNEEGAGVGIRRACAEGLVQRSDLFIQTKVSLLDPAFTNFRDQYSTVSSFVHASVASSMSKLCSVDLGSPPYLDCVLLHEMYEDMEETLEAWRALEKHVPSQIRLIGMCNVTDRHALEKTLAVLALNHLQPPDVIQNGFLPAQVVEAMGRLGDGYDHAIREDCAGYNLEKRTPYQAFWVLTANTYVWKKEWYVLGLASVLGISPAAAWYALLISLDIVVLNGTRNVQHMKEDIEGVKRALAWRDDVASGKHVWRMCLEEVAGLTNTSLGITSWFKEDTNRAYEQELKGEAQASVDRSTVQGVLKSEAEKLRKTFMY
ncbi:NADP-dependent oxidoreductase domain-containing protein [Apodospora peruviana]|uniref:NADP-dependent oxidoreductase domain-containing protein n=1 Tax=Apodospora peruviana TaxID=516989 RepID=A0AAE0M124_9PEZI|nr:NADP-dependent oxidoreductase domain-containing protein [Apodospora peruviana]